ncbi:restriction endonuclease subunit S [Moraxella catarrhalis]|uniref:restriction endonuclease subunit S n=1 Tax=Moraxella catarrhalis TaxID=480 RepID=UPI0007E42088|nr:restriction endonuclease subunit S [Moraxella catarrhalis]OAV33918.1 Type I restriction-modification system, specificity subunit S [Moraxella catarrhalis]
MNAMIKKLLQGQAVEWQTLGEVANLNRGRVMSKTYLADNIGEYPVYSSQTANNGEIGKINTFDFEGEFITWTTDGANAGTVFYRNEKFSITNVCGLITLKYDYLTYKFLFYWLSIQAKKHVYSGMGNPKLMSNQMEKIQIPIPPLSVQSHIVQILDTFTELNGQLTAEFGMRQKQYQYYRDFLLSEHELAKVGFEWKTLGEVANYEQPTKYLVKSKDYDDDFKTPVLTAGKTFILGYTNETNGIYQASKNPVIIFDDFTTANKWVDFDFKAKSSAMKMISSVDENQFLLKYIYYWLNTLPSGLVDGDHKRQWISNFANKKIPIPPLSVQSQIVAILDTFDTLTQSISEGLPKEIKLRQKQYEYYRERLLNFKATI